MITATPYSSNPIGIPALKNFIVNNVENISDINALQRIYAIIISNSESYEQKFKAAKLQTDLFCPKEIAQELEAGGYMINKPFPFDEAAYNLDLAEKEDLEDEPAPEEWLQKMFPEVYA
ncbi:MAG: hypothetical protein PUC50_11340 [Bacteroidales bacterium]|nr:hypothetical protein [Bacteroidales bacterium]